MPNKKLYYLIGLCLSLDDHPENCELIQFKFTSGEISLEEFIRFCDKHLVLQVIYLKLKTHNLLDIFKAELKTHIAGIYLRNKQRNMSILQQAGEISQTLKKGNINPIYLKGTAHLLDNLYSDNGERLIGDIDLLVQENDYLESVELLKELGYYTFNSEVYYDVTQSTHYPPLFREGAPVHLEIHRLPVNPPYSKGFSTELCFNQKKKISEHPNCYVQSDEHQLIHNFIHSQLNNLGYQFRVAQLRDLYDFYLLSKRVNKKSILDQSEEKEKLTAYFALSDKVLNPKEHMDGGQGKHIKHYLSKFDWYLEHPSRHHFRILFVKLNELLFYRFFPSLGRIFTLKFWLAFFRNLADPGFYKMLAYRVRHFYQFYIRKNKP